MPLIAEFDELGVVRLLDIVGAHPLEHVAEQVELPVGVGRRRLARSLRRTRCVVGWRCSVRATPAAAPRRIREVLRIIREPFRLRLRPTMGLDRREIPSLRNST